MVVILRLWRVIKVISLAQPFAWHVVLNYSLQIIEELSAGAEEEMAPLREKIEVLERENASLKRENAELKTQQASKGT